MLNFLLLQITINEADQIKTEMKLFRKQKVVTFDDLLHESNENICYALGVFEKDIEHLSKFLKLCREGKNEIEKALFEPLNEHIEVLKVYF